MEENKMNETTKELLGKIEKLMEEYATEDIEADILRKEIKDMIDNRV